MYWPQSLPVEDRGLAAVPFVGCHPRSSTSSRPCSCWRWRRRSTSATCSWRGAAWPSAGTRTSRPPAASSNMNATCRRSTRGRPAGTARGAVARRQRHSQRRQGVGGGGAQGPGGGGPQGLRGSRTRPRTVGRASQERPVRHADARPLGRAPLRPLPLLPRVGSRLGQRDLLHRRGRHDRTVGSGELQRRDPHGAGRLAAVRRVRPSRTRRRTGSSGS